jgi:hypothetical protein
MLEPTIPPPTMTTSAVCMTFDRERLSILAQGAGERGQLGTNTRRWLLASLRWTDECVHPCASCRTDMYRRGAGIRAGA